VALLLGIVTTRFRDMAPITQSLVQLLFFLTPIVWIYQDLLDNPAVADRARLVEFNPLLHFIEIVRQPLLGEEQHLRHWIVVLVITVVGWALTFAVVRRFRSRVAYWV
jgi:ABC-2 type transport system permease protein